MKAANPASSIHLQQPRLHQIRLHRADQADQTDEQHWIMRSTVLDRMQPDICVLKRVGYRSPG